MTPKCTVQNTLKRKDRTHRAWFSRLLRHPARKRSGSILSTRRPGARARTGHWLYCHCTCTIHWGRTVCILITYCYTNVESETYRSWSWFDLMTMSCDCISFSSSSRRRSTSSRTASVLGNWFARLSTSALMCDAAHISPITYIRMRTVRSR